MRKLLPLRIRIDVGSGRLHAYQIEACQKWYHRIALMALPCLPATAALLVIFTSRKTIFASFAVGMVAAVVLSSINDWPQPDMLPPSLDDRPPLPLLAQPFGPPNASSPLIAGQRFLDAAKAGDLATMKLGVSEELLQILDKENRWEELLLRLAKDTGEMKALDETTIRSILGTEVDPLKTVVYWKGAQSGDPMTMVFEDGDWREYPQKFDTPMARENSSPFHSTRWTLVWRAQGDGAEARAALS